MTSGVAFIFRRILILAFAIGLGISGAISVSPVAAANPTPPAPTLFTSWWVETHLPTHLWSAPSDPAVDYGAIPPRSFLLVVAPQTSPRLSVFVAWTKNYAYVDARAVGPSGPPSADWLAAVTGATPSENNKAWVGRVVAGGIVEQQAPSKRSAVRRTLPAGSLVQVIAWVIGDEQTWGNWTWARLADGGYAYSAALQAVVPTSPPPMPAVHPMGKWIDVNLLRQTAVAYQDSTPLYLASVSTGSPGWETSLGTHRIQRRVADETMNGMTLNHLGLDAWHSARVSYNLSHVHETQYFNDQGDALHENYWLPVGQFGIPHSHGCVGLKLSDAQWFWNWATIGVPVVVRAS
jgi:hypothetical protein